MVKQKKDFDPNNPPKKKKRKYFNVKAKVIAALRLISMRSPMNQDILNYAKIQVPSYKQDGTLATKYNVRYVCNQCKKLFFRDEVHVDHIHPVVDYNKKSGEVFVYDIYIHELFYGFAGYSGSQAELQLLKEKAQVLCVTCHADKTAKENVLRAESRKGRFKFKTPEELEEYKKKLYQTTHEKAKNIRYKKIKRTHAVVAASRKHALNPYNIPPEELLRQQKDLTWEERKQKIKDRWKVRDLKAQERRKKIKEKKDNDNKE